MADIFSYKQKKGVSNTGSVLYHLLDPSSGKNLLTCSVSTSECDEFEKLFNQDKDKLKEHFNVQDIKCVKLSLV